MLPHVICTAVGTASYTSSDATCLSVQEHQYYAITKQGDPSWWCARLIGSDGQITDKIGLIPADHVCVVGPGFIKPEEAAGASKSHKKEKKKKKARRSVHVSAITIVDMGEPGKPEVQQQPQQQHHESGELEALRHKVKSLEKMLAKAESTIASMKVCGADVVPVEQPTARDGRRDSQQEDTSGVDALVKEGYDRAVLLKLKQALKSYVLRKRFREVAMDFKGHKASLVMRLRNEALREIYTSEKKYVDALRLCLAAFYTPLQRATHAPKGQRIISRGQLGDVFHSLDVIVELNSGLLDDLRSRLDQWPSVQKFGDLFLRMAPILRLYSAYVRNFEQAQKVLASCRENPAFDEFLAEYAEKAQGLTLESYLIMPVQRLPRYQLLLQGLLKYTDQNHVDFQDLTNAQQSIVTILVEMNQAKQLDENQKALRTLVEEVEGLLEVLGSSAYFIHRGHLHSLMGASIDTFHYILLDDMLVKCQQSTRKRGSAVSWVVHEVVPIVRLLGATDIPDMEGIRNCIEFKVLMLRGEGSFKLEKEVTLGLCSTTPADKAVWLQRVQYYQQNITSAEMQSKLADSTVAVKEDLLAQSDGPASGLKSRMSLRRKPSTSAILSSSAGSVSQIPSSPSSSPKKVAEAAKKKE